MLEKATYYVAIVISLDVVNILLRLTLLELIYVHVAVVVMSSPDEINRFDVRVLFIFRVFSLCFLIYG